MTQVASLEDAKYLPEDDMERADRLISIRDAKERGLERIAADIPSRYLGAKLTDPTILCWVNDLIQAAGANRRAMPVIGKGMSLLLLGPTGTGKTYQAYAALQALSLSGMLTPWCFATAADIYAKLRPRHKVDSEEVFRGYANTRLLVIDDLGAAKSTEWTEEVNYRLINHRYEQELPTIITSNVAVPELKAAIGDRVASRLAEMTVRVTLKGEDRRRMPKDAA